jgi:hypothetical protein
LPEKRQHFFSVFSRDFTSYPGTYHFSELPLKARRSKGVTTQGQAG